MLTQKVILISAAMLLVFFSSSYATESTPEPGAACSEQGTNFNYVSNIDKTDWQLKDLYAVPVGTTDPLTWEYSPDFEAQFIAQLQSGDTPQAFSQACAAVWGNYFTGDTEVILSVSRTITSTHKTLRCDSGIWAILSTENVEVDDVSDWLAANGNPYNVTDPNAPFTLETDLQNILTNLNAQPGAN